MYLNSVLWCDKCKDHLDHFVYRLEGYKQCASCATRAPHPPLTAQEREWQDFLDELMLDKPLDEKGR